MSTLRWIGGASPVAQVQSWTFSGTWIIGETITVTIGSKVWTWTVDNATIATLLADLVTAYNVLSASVYPELLEQTASNDSTHFILTADVAGKPFISTISTNSAAGTINGGASSTGTTTTASSGPNDWSTSKNWSTGAVPTTGDTVNLDYAADDIKYGLAQSGLTLAALNIFSTFTGTLGLSKTNTDATDYPEYRQDYLQIGATLCNIGTGPGAGSQRIKHDAGSVACAWTVTNSSNGIETDLEAVILKGTSASNTLTVTKGSVGVAVFGGEAANISGGVNIGYQGSQTSDSQVRLASGVTLASVSQSGGQVTINSACTLTMTSGTTTIAGSGATTATVEGGTLIYNGSGNPTLTIGQSGFVDFNQAKTALTLGATIISYAYPGFQDSAKRIASLAVQYKGVDVEPFGFDVTLTRS